MRTIIPWFSGGRRAPAVTFHLQPVGQVEVSCRAFGREDAVVIVLAHGFSARRNVSNVVRQETGDGRRSSVACSKS